MQIGPTRVVGGIEVPLFVYGSAWKEDATEGLIRQALDAGFRGIDTANQRKHYFEAGVGAGLAGAIDAGVVTREDVFLQTKFTYQRGQDHRLPYDPNAPLTEQVAQSFERSLEHLRTSYIDSLVLHGPELRQGVTDNDWAVWRAMEAIHDSGRVRLLGVSNVGLDQLEALHAGARIKPVFVQNRCYAQLGWDHAIRQFCSTHGVVYQGFSLLTANRHVLKHPDVLAIAAKQEATPAQVIFRFALQVGMQPLTGTTDPAHMAQDLAAFGLSLGDEEVFLLERVGVTR